MLNGQSFILLNPGGRIAADEKHLLIIAVLLMLIVVLPVIILTLSFAWRYRAGNSKASYLPNWEHHARLEVLWWSIPCVIVAILATITWFSSYRLDPYRPLAVSASKELTIQAVALEWKWLFIYPEQNIASLNFIQVPVGVPLHFLITAEGPMNALHIPQLGGQIYAMAGMQTQLHLIADLPGRYRGLATNFSGEGFS
ncbi:MAG TPA: ubiquinol oxidase subunit II, partial [Gammaproteobacteria bacterium]|nr:ubiquinol oxidase subunit II [Gammaproteobacteria bacterium]